MNNMNNMNFNNNNMNFYNNNMMNNNMMNNNNMFGNNMMNNNNMMGNNMMNNNINNMMNNLNNMNNLINNNINPMMGNINMNMNQYPNIPKSFTVIFRHTGNDTNKLPIMVNVKENEKISDIIQKYRQKSSNYDINLKFIFNSKDLNHLNHSLTVAEAGITNNANIFVVKRRI